MDIFTKPLTSLSFDDIVNFAKENYQEGVQLEYKEIFPDKDKLSQLIAAFSNTQGGVIIIGIKENRDNGYPAKYDGIADNHIDELFAQIVGNISPIPKCEFHKTNAKAGKVFILIRVYEGDETPYYPHNDSNIWFRTGSIKKAVEIASPEHIELLFRKAERAELGRIHNHDRADFNYQAFLKNAEKERLKEIDIEKENYQLAKRRLEDGDTMPPFKSQIVKNPLGSNAAMFTVLLQPYYPHSQFVRPRDIEPIIQESEARNSHYTFPSRQVNWNSITEGMITFNWNKHDGEIDCQQVFANGLVYTGHDVLRNDPQHGIYTHLAWFTSQLYVTLKGAKNILTKFGYQGSLIGELKILGILGHKVYPIIESMFGGINTSVFEYKSWSINIDTRMLYDDQKLKDYVTDASRDIHWSFGYKDIQKNINVEVLTEKRYFQE